MDIKFSDVNMDFFVRLYLFSRSSAESTWPIKANKLSTNPTNKIIVLLKSINRNDTGRLNTAMSIYII